MIYKDVKGNVYKMADKRRTNTNTNKYKQTFRSRMQVFVVVVVVLGSGVMVNLFQLYNTLVLRQ